MTEFVMASIQWAKVEDIDETEPLNESDFDCISDLKQVLARHGKTKKFGLTLIHSHFPIEDDEVLVEHVHKKDRRLVIEPMKIKNTNSTVDTQWSFDEDTVLVKCKVKCYIHPPGHDVQHI